MFKNSKSPTAQKKLHSLWRSLYLSIMLMLVVNMSYLGVFFVVKDGAGAPPLTSAAMAADWPSCSWNTSSKDVTLNSLWLGDSTGAALNSFSCSIGQEITAYIWGSFKNTTSNDMASVILLADVYTDNTESGSIDNCLSDKILNKADSIANLYQLNWECGSEIRLDNIIVTWDKDATCTGNFTPRTCLPPSKASTYATINVKAPLITNFNYSPGNICVNDEVSFSDETTGGKNPYTYLWNFGVTPIATSTLQNPTHTYSAAGIYSVSLVATDDNSNTDSETKNITVNAPGVNGCPETVTYSWYQSGFESATCVGACGTGTKTQTVECRDN